VPGTIYDSYCFMNQISLTYFIIYLMKFRYRIYFIFSLIGFLALTSQLYSQDSWWKEKKYNNHATRIKYELCKKTFKDVAQGLSVGNVNFINLYFDNQVYLNIISFEKGYYSASQAELMLSNFMYYFRVNRFNYVRSSRFSTYAFANGTYRYMLGGSKRDLSVTISLKYNGSRWYIDQININ
jgi:hypothetical protein